MTLHNQMKTVLLPVLLATTRLAREKFETNKSGARKEQFAKWVQKNGNLMDNAYLDALLGLVAIIEDDPSIGMLRKVGGRGTTYDPFTVLVLQKDTSGHGMTIGEPIIVTHGIKFYFLTPGGATDGTVFTMGDDPRLATDKEVALCVHELTAIQLRGMLKSAVFEPIFEPMLEQGLSEEAETTSPDEVTIAVNEGRATMVPAQITPDELTRLLGR